jgi:hypothetical protein
MDYLLAIIDATETMLTSLGPLGKRLLQGLGIDWPEGRRGEVPVLRSYRREKLVEALKSLLLDQVDEVDVPFVRLCAINGSLLPARKRTFRMRPNPAVRAFKPDAPKRTLKGLGANPAESNASKKEDVGAT